METKKSRILYIKQFLEKNTDEDHPVTTQDILAHLESLGIKADRRAVSADIGQLVKAGVDVVCNSGKRHEYFVGERLFELPELKLLIDAVQASRFISAKKSKALIDKLIALASVHQAAELNRRLYMDKQPKPDNENVYVTMDLLYTAVNAGKQITFKYYEYDRHKQKVFKHNRMTYVFSPYGLIWSNDFYYAVGYSESHQKVVCFRVDRIAMPELTNRPAVSEPEGFDIANYAQSVFQMYDGPVQDVTLKCENSLMKSVIDRFGEDVDTEILDDEHFLATAPVSASPTFFGWVFSFGGRMEILEPDNVVADYLAQACRVASKGLQIKEIFS